MGTGNVRAVTVTPILKPARKLIVRLGVHSTDYFSYCEEIGCDIWNDLEKLPGRLDMVSFVILPEAMTPNGCSHVGCAAEVPSDYEGPIPDGCRMMQIPEHWMLWFQGAPYEDDSWYGGAHEEMAAAVRSYRPELYGYRFAYEEAPEFHYGTTAKDGCRQIVPAARLLSSATES